MQKTLAAILFATTILTNSKAQSSTNPFYVDGVAYEVTDANHGYVTVTGLGTSASETVTIPQTVENNCTTYTVTAIASHAFQQTGTTISSLIVNSSGANEEGFYIGDSIFYAGQSVTTLSTLELNGRIASIGVNAFRYCPLTKLTMPKGVGHIYNGAFQNCTVLTSVDIVADTIGESAFADGSIAQVTLKGVKVIENDAFYNDNNLTEIAIPRTTKVIKNKAFGSCHKLTTVTIPKGVTELGDYVFAESGLVKAYIEGNSKLKSLGEGIFTNCAIESFVVPEGVETINANTFYHCIGLHSVTLPSTLTSIGENAFFETTSLKDVKLHAQTVPDTVANSFNGIGESTGVKLLVPTPAKYEGWSSIFKGGISELYTFDKEETSLDATTAQGFSDALTALAVKDGDFSDKDVTMEAPVSYDPMWPDLGIMSADNVFRYIDGLRTVESYNGKMEASTISNLTVRSSGLFGTLGSEAEVNNLYLDNAIIYIDPTDEKYVTDGKTVYVPILAKELQGKVTNFGFNGQIIVDSEDAKDKEIVMTIVDEAGDEAELSGFMHLGDVLTTSNEKRCIIIKQNLGLRNGPGKKVKVAMQRSSGGKTAKNKAVTLPDYDEEELMQSVRYFSEEEFANGVVAYWLNFSDAGYTGEYTGRWSQGKTVPVAATTKNGVSNALYKVDYGKTDLKKINGPVFANNGSTIKITYSDKPSSVTMGGSACSFGTNSVELTFDHNKPVEILFSNDTETSLDTPQETTISVSTNGKDICISGAEGESKTLFNLAGVRVATTTGEMLTAPASGIYIIRIGNKAQRIAVR